MQSEPVLISILTHNLSARCSCRSTSRLLSEDVSILAQSLGCVQPVGIFVLDLPVKVSILTQPLGWVQHQFERGVPHSAVSFQSSPSISAGRNLAR